MLPFTTTKVGPGDKTKAYVVRQNTCLKILLFLLVAAASTLMVLSSTLYDVHIERRAKARETGAHRREEHNLRLQVSRMGMRLQEQLHEEVRDMASIRVYRARMLRAIGDYQNAVRKTIADSCGDGAVATAGALTKLDLGLDEHLERAMSQLWDDVNEEGKRASEKLHNLTQSIIADLKSEQDEVAQFEEQYGEGSDYHDDAEHGYHGDDLDDPEAPSDAAPPPADDEANPEDQHMRDSLARVWERVVAMPNITLTTEEIEEWDAAYVKALDAMGDPEKETDIAKIEAQLAERMKSKGLAVLTSPPNAPTDGTVELAPSVLNQFEEAIEAAKVMPHKADLALKFAAWRAGEVSVTELTQFVEELNDDGVLTRGLYDDDDLWDHD